jgi:hypothetical protein
MPGLNIVSNVLCLSKRHYFVSCTLGCRSRTTSEFLRLQFNVHHGLLLTLLHIATFYIKRQKGTNELRDIVQIDDQSND